MGRVNGGVLKIALAWSYSSNEVLEIALNTVRKMIKAPALAGFWLPWQSSVED